MRHIPRHIPRHTPRPIPAIFTSLLVACLPLGMVLSGCSDFAPASSIDSTESGGGSSSGGAASNKNSGQPASNGGGSSGGGGSSSGGSSNTGSTGSTGSTGANSGEKAGDTGPGGSTPSKDSSGGNTSEAKDTTDTPSTGAKVCNTKDAVVKYLSADDSNSMAGATITRGLIEQGQHVFKGLRTYEFLNYYDFNYAPASVGQLSVTAQLREIPAKSGLKPKSGAVNNGPTYQLQIGVRAPQTSVKDRRNVHLVLAVDTSSSMGWGPAGNTGLDRAQAACLALAGSLRKGDHLSLIAWDRQITTLLKHHAVSQSGDPKILAQCAKLVAAGTTQLSAALQAAYGLADTYFDAKQMNRVVLISDGGTNVGEKDAKLIGDWAKAADGKTITLMGIGVGDPWNYNDTLMNTVTDAGKGAYVFFDDSNEASKTFGDAFLRHMEVAARNVQVQLTLPPSFSVQAFYGEQISSKKSEVEPQHLAANDAMIFHQVISSCAPTAVTGKEKIAVMANWIDPTTGKVQQAKFEASLTDLLSGDTLLLRKGAAVVAYVEALKAVRNKKGSAAIADLDDALKVVDAALTKLPNDVDLLEIKGLLSQHKLVFSKGPTDLYPTGGTGAKSLSAPCSTCKGSGNSLSNMACALDLCDANVLLEQNYASPTKSVTKGTFGGTAHYGNTSNDLKAKVGGSYAVMATGPAFGKAHSKDMGGSSMTDPYAGGPGVRNAMEYTLKLKAPKGAGGFRLQHVFFSEEYDEYVGSKFNDKFYIVIKAGSTNGGKPTVINYTACRQPEKHYDFVCSPGMQYCNPRQRYCFIAINTAVSECCWLNGCPQGTAKTDISGTGFSCGAKGKDTAKTGSSTGWLTTEWPIEPGEIFTLTFHVHDTGDGIYDSAVILDGLQFVKSVTPGTWTSNTL